jgi:hypothetical protein
MAITTGITTNGRKLTTVSIAHSETKQSMKIDLSSQGALMAQARIGWLGMLIGYWTREWQTASEQTYPVPGDESRKKKNKWLITMKEWQMKILQTTWRFMIKFGKYSTTNMVGIEKAEKL